MGGEGNGIYWWTNGFWVGVLWQLYHATNQESYRATAEVLEKRFDTALEGFLGLHHDVGFMWLHTAIANYRLTGNETSKRRGLHAATILAGRYNPNGQFLRAWNHDRIGWMIVDSMMNIPILYWAAAELGDPRFTTIAKAHADTCMNTIVRTDGSCNHIISFDPATGEYLDNPGGQGYASGSAWSRGNAWALYGFALSYLHTKDENYLNTAKKIAHYFIANLAQTDWIPLADFRSPKEPIIQDSTAGMIAACGMLEIAKHVPEHEKDLYRTSAINVITACEKAFANWNVDEDSIMSGGTEAYHSGDKARHVPIIYGDYFFVEAVLRLLDKDFLIW
ncbi:MAG: glycoside hydrolase family 88 protein [Defluviitaleaceae bacterium]|nr:glycoside hydrolase family 88 protein [Defluviitaleaceae bacterium]